MTENMMLGNSHAITVNFIGAVIVIAVTIWFAYRCTGKVKKLTPVDAIRNGQSGERFKRNPFTGWEKAVLTVPGIWQSMIF